MRRIGYYHINKQEWKEKQCPNIETTSDQKLKDSLGIFFQNKGNLKDLSIKFCEKTLTTKENKKEILRKLANFNQIIDLFDNLDKEDLEV